MGEVLPATTVEIVDGGSMITTPLTVAIGSTYTVNWNGTDYVCVAADISAVMPGSAVLGNLGALGFGDDTGEPFAVIVIPPETAAQTGTYGAINVFDGSTEVTISVIGEIVTYHKLDPNCMPDGMTPALLVVASVGDSMDKATYTPLEIFGQCGLGGKAGFFANGGRTLTLVKVNVERATFESIYFEDGGLYRHHVIIEEDGTISDFGFGNLITLNT
jgi:hypothetical protein